MGAPMSGRHTLGARRATPRRGTVTVLVAAITVFLPVPIGPGQALIAAEWPPFSAAGSQADRGGEVVVHLPELGGADSGGSGGFEVAGFTACEVQDSTGAMAGETGIRVALDSGGLPVVTRGTDRVALSCGSEQFTDSGTASTLFTLHPGTYVVYESTPRFAPDGEAQGGDAFATLPAVVVVPPRTAAATRGERSSGAIEVFPKAAPAAAAEAGPGVSSEVFGDEIRQTVTVPVSGLGEGAGGDLRIAERLARGVKLVGTSLVLVRADGTLTQLAEPDFVERRGEDAAGSSLEIELTRRGLDVLAEHPTGVLQLEATLSPETSGSTAASAAVSVNGERIREAVSGRVENPNIEYFWNYAHLLTMVTDVGATEERPLSGVVFDVYLFDKLSPYCPDAPTGSSLWSKKNVVADADGKVFNRTLGQAYYCFYQVSIPPGYKGGADAPVLLLVNAEGAHEVVHYSQVGSDASDLPDLPLTGSAAGVALVTLGALFLGVAGWLGVVRYRRGNSEQVAPLG